MITILRGISCLGGALKQVPFYLAVHYCCDDRLTRCPKLIHCSQLNLLRIVEHDINAMCMDSVQHKMRNVTVVCLSLILSSNRSLLRCMQMPERVCNKASDNNVHLSRWMWNATFVSLFITTACDNGSKSYDIWDVHNVWLWRCIIHRIQQHVTDLVIHRIRGSNIGVSLQKLLRVNFGAFLLTIVAFWAVSSVTRSMGTFTQ